MRQTKLSLSKPSLIIGAVWLFAFGMSGRHEWKLFATTITAEQKAGLHEWQLRNEDFLLQTHSFFTSEGHLSKWAHQVYQQFFIKNAVPNMDVMHFCLEEAIPLVNGTKPKS